jgi:hypothetical protein
VGVMNLIAAVTAALSIAAGQTPAAPSSGAHPLWSRLPGVCADLQSRGWKASTEGGLKTEAEMSLPGGFYMCMLQHPLEGVGPGHGPQVQVLLRSTTSGDTGAVFSANVWCAGDVERALQGLAAELERILQTVGVTPPAEVLAATRAGRTLEVKGAPGIAYSVVPIEVDKDACGRVAPGALGAVYMKIDVALEPTR